MKTTCLVSTCRGFWHGKDIAGKDVNLVILEYTMKSSNGHIFCVSGPPQTGRRMRMRDDCSIFHLLNIAGQTLFRRRFSYFLSSHINFCVIYTTTHTRIYMNIYIYIYMKIFFNVFELFNAGAQQVKHVRESCRPVGCSYSTVLKQTWFV